VSDELRGLKENVIIGHLIPAGTGIRYYRNVKLYDSDATDLDVQMNEIVERRRIEKELEAQQELEDLVMFETDTDRDLEDD
jgi:DNA-directed RNA polymerase subunit beta'